MLVYGPWCLDSNNTFVLDESLVLNLGSHCDNCSSFISKMHLSGEAKMKELPVANK